MFRHDTHRAERGFSRFSRGFGFGGHKHRRDGKVRGETTGHDEEKMRDHPESGEERFRWGHEGRRFGGRGGESRGGRGFFGGRGPRGGAGRFGGGFGDDAFGRGRKLTAEELQIVIEALLHDQPAHGYELIRRLEEHSGGFYKPSPGVIYPSLTYLEEAGLTAVTQEGNRKLYSLTDEGRTHYEAIREQATRILEILARIGARMSEVRDAFSGVNDLDPSLGQDFHEARLALKMALKSRRGANADELRRVVGILRRAADEISGKANEEKPSED
ncbi:PadR family transcriptional regulator [Gluconobacter japonicus]|uniref:PadR family transcriptional regulator n=1 Tax=Gluconobacter japonicus TaxID=376620 RepID=UPI0039ED1ECA